MYDERITKSFTMYRKKKLPLWACAGLSMLALNLCALLNSYMGPLPLYSLQFANNLNMKIFPVNSMKSDTSWPQRAREVVNQVQRKRFDPVPTTICNFSSPKSNYCDISGDVRINGNASSIYTSSSLQDYTEGNKNKPLKLKPYALKIDKYVMKRVRELSLGTPSSFGLDHMPHCSINHSVPGIVFSCGGYAGNPFHDFSDILVPLFITSGPFNGEVQVLITDLKPEWLIKYRALLSSLTKYKIIDADSSKEVHCFKSTTIGLKGHKEFGIDPSQTSQGHSMTNFTQFVREVYALERNNLGPLRIGCLRKPRILIISRKKSRAFVNEDEVAEEARRLGYDVEVVVVDAQMKLEEFSKMVNSFDVMLGVHGAGLTNCVFLPENAVLIQVVPLGLEWLSKHDFGLPSMAMKLRYLEYRISGKESSLADKYDLDHPLIRDPNSVEGWFAFKKVYLDGQNVRIDVARFRDTLLKALELLKQ